jgi:hypothetical protein
MIARLGFADPDKGNPKHDLACQYLAANLGPLVSVVQSDTWRVLKVSKCEMEHMISKGYEQYKTTIGFVDLLVPVMAGVTETDANGQPKEWHHQEVIAVEVKINRVSVGDALRQIRLYRGYRIAWGDVHWILATSFPVSKLDLETLKASDVHHVFLGRAFERWAEEQSRAQRDEPTPMIEI